MRGINDNGMEHFMLTETKILTGSFFTKINPACEYPDTGLMFLFHIK